MKKELHKILCRCVVLWIFFSSTDYIRMTTRLYILQIHINIRRLLY